MQSKYDNAYSVIDLGTNTCLLLIAAIKDNIPVTLYEAQEIPRIGKNLYETKHISEEAFGKVSDIFKKYISVSGKYNVKQVYAFGTSALREAVNSNEFIKYIETQTGVKITVISGNEEARYSFEGALFDIGNPGDYAVIDIGGGSTELSLLKNGIVESFSLNVGSVRLNELFFKDDYSEKNMSVAGNFILEKINKAEFKIPEGKKLAGVAGTITTLSAVKNKLKDFDSKVIHKDIMKISEIETMYGRLIHMTKDERLNIGTYMKGRSDIIIPGALILIKIMQFYNFDSLIVSAKGLRYGLMLNLSEFK